MTVRYEANPPKVLPGADPGDSVARFVERIRAIAPRCDAIHLTENVLGFERVSPLEAGRILKREIPGITITSSLRVRDKGEEEIVGFVQECVRIGFAGILVVMGDPSRSGRADSGMVPSRVVGRLGELGLRPGIDLYLSVPSSPDYAKMRKKLDAKPDGFMTQVVQDVAQVRGLAENLGNRRVIPILLYPSKKNARSAEFLGLDLGRYADGFGEFVRQAHEITGDVLLTSPNDFEGLCGFLDGFEA